MSNLPPGCTPSMLDDAWGDPRPYPARSARCPACGGCDEDQAPNPECLRCNGEYLTTDDLTARELSDWLAHRDHDDPPPTEADGTDSPEHRFGVDA